MEKYVKIFYDSCYFEETAHEFKKSLSIEIPMIHLLDSDDEKKDWNNTIYFCFGLNRWLDMRNLPPYYVVMQLEPVSIRGFQSEKYLIICARAMAIFDYSRFNLKMYKEFNIPKKKIYLLEIGRAHIQDNQTSTLMKKNREHPNKSNSSDTNFNSSDTNTSDSISSKSSERDVDILFLGQMTDHRQSVMNKIKKRFPEKNIQIFANLWGKQRDQVVARSRVVLNIHTENEAQFPLETPRLLYFSNFNIHIFSEKTRDLNEENRWMSRVHFCDSNFDLLGELFADEKSENKLFVKRDGRIPKMNSRFGDFCKNFDIITKNYTQSYCAHKWFDSDYKIFQQLDLEDKRLPNIYTYELANLPEVSIITITTLERMKKWKDLMIWNNRNRIYQDGKLEWIIVVEKPDKTLTKEFNKIKQELNRQNVKPIFLFYENKQQELYLQITEKRNLAIEKCTKEFIDIMDDDDIEIPDALKIKMIVLQKLQKKCVGSKSILCLDLLNGSMFVKNACFPTESTLTFHRSFAKVGFVPSMHGEGSLMVLSQVSDVIDMPCSLNLIAVTHENNVTGKSRTSKSDGSSCFKNLQMFLDDQKVNQLMEILYS